MDNTVNKRIRYFRRLANLTQGETAKLMNMKYTTYSQMERQGKIKAETVLRLANIFGVKPESLLCDGESTEIDVSPKVLTVRQKPALPEDNQIILTHKETNIIKIYRNMSKEEREQFELAMEAIYKNKKG
ncbi:MAG: helix-turn-helix domain-containing protein [Clostridia bacterium]|nr:helix-turn-helix domain-containing protein [Clostridia bacterium]